MKVPVSKEKKGEKEKAHIISVVNLFAGVDHGLKLSVSGHVFLQLNAYNFLK